ncbi:hypothetical protein P5V15_001210 [Pogonomyrmex californicus]
MGVLLSGDRQSEIDHIYGVYFDEGGSMLGDKRFNVAIDDSVIVGDARYPDTPSLYELIFKRFPDDVTENDKQTYKSILDYERPSAWSQRSREQRFQVQAYHRAVFT